MWGGGGATNSNDISKEGSAYWKIVIVTVSPIIAYRWYFGRKGDLMVNVQ